MSKSVAVTFRLARAHLAQNSSKRNTHNKYGSDFQLMFIERLTRYIHKLRKTTYSKKTIKTVLHNLGIWWPKHL